MLDPGLTPTRLLNPAERPAVEIVKARPPARFMTPLTCYNFLRWFIRGFFLRIIRKKGADAEQARRLRLLFEELGGIWVKAGQFISLRSDLFSAEICRELSMLLDSATGFPFDVAHRITEAELQAPLSDVFDAFEEAPFAAASIGQLHKAHLRHEDVWVAVKVQRPFVAQLVTDQLALLWRIVGFLEALSIWPHARWRDLYWELEHILQEEVDYRFEASNIRRIRKNLRRHGIYVPKVFSRYSSRHLLVMEFIEGALMADYLQLMKSDPDRLQAWRQENNIDQRRVADKLYQSNLRQMFEDNLYHGDLHPGNIILLRDGRIALIDCGTVGFLELEILEKFRLIVRAIVEFDYDKAADMTFLLAASLPVKNLDHVKEDLVRSYRAWGARTFVKQLPYKEKSLAGCWQEALAVYQRYRCTFAWEVVRIFRSYLTLDATLMHLHPEVNYTVVTKRYFRRAQRRSLRRFATRKSAHQLLTNLVSTVQLPQKIEELAFYHSALARKQAKVFAGTTSKLAHLFAVLFGNLTLLCVLSGIAIVFVLLDRHAPALVWPIPKGIIEWTVRAAPAFGTDTWLLLLALVAYLGWTFSRLRQHFRLSEVDRSRISVGM
jgi:ubiquinone biosynthesis protein